MMPSKQILYLTKLLLLTLYLFSCKNNSEKALFTKLDSTQTNITFVNKLVENDEFNIIEYLYYYNGGGVATGDINNDGLADIFFTSNQGENKLYLNKGDFKFEDISKKAGITGAANWKTGVTMADVNADGLLDIYVCTVGDYKGFKGKNELYINNGNNSFTEKAAEYGLDFSGFSTQAAFFDYDHDGDLDMYLLTHSVHSTRSYDKASTRIIPDTKSGDYLFRNELINANNKTSKGVSPMFTDVTAHAGIYQAIMGYGLGISVADFNNDGWEDIYVSNDFHEDDYYYLNQQDGTFKELGKETFGHTSRFSMGSDAADINNDGYTDLLTLDMYPEDEVIEKSSAGEDPFDIFQYKLTYGYGYQYARNCLQLNHEGKYFSDIANITGLAATDWSWSPLMADFDNDGIKDIFITNGIMRRPNNLDYIKYLSDGSTQGKSNIEIAKLMPEGKVHNYIFKGSNTLKFEDKSLLWGFEDANLSNGSAYADLDNDGDLDLVTNNVNEVAGVYQNNSKGISTNNTLTIKLKGNNGNTFGIGTKVIAKTNGFSQYQQLMTTHGFMSSSEPVLHFGLSDKQTVDSLIVIWDNQKIEVKTNLKANSTIVIRQSDAKLPISALKIPVPQKSVFQDVSLQEGITYKHIENSYSDFSREILSPFQLSTEGPALAIGDVNQDGFDDIYIGGAKGQAGQLLLQSGNKFITQKQKAFDLDAKPEDIDASFFDADKDGDLDLYVVSGGNEDIGNSDLLLDRLYLNDGKGNFSKAVEALPKTFANKSCVKPFDYDKDGDLDLFVGGRSVVGHYGFKADSYLLLNNGHGHFTDETQHIAPQLKNIGMITDAQWVDYDNDKDSDLIICGDWMGPQIFENHKNKLNLADNEISNLKGFWQTITVADMDKDGDQDLLLGNLGTNNKFIKGSAAMLKMYVKDLDKNETTEQILAYNRADKWYTVATKDELGKEMPSIINKKFTNYALFAGKTVQEIFAENELQNAKELEVNTFESMYFENDGKGNFNPLPLPFKAQLSKVFAITVADFNHDSKLDVLLGGNFYGASMYQGRYDASRGLLLQGNGKGNFSAISTTKSGLNIEGEIRKIAPIQGGKFYIVARNNASLIMLADYIN